MWLFSRFVPASMLAPSPPKALDRRCGTCAFHRNPGPTRDGTSYECVRYAPRQSTDFHYARWPMTGTYDWCGEWEARPAAS